MHLIYILIGFYVMEYGVALDDPKSAHILKYDFENIGTGPYHFSFDTSDGISRQEVGHVEQAGTQDEFVKVSGSYSYTGPDGVLYEVRYTADDQGFHPEGEHIMVPPFVPWIHHYHHHDEHHHDGTKIGIGAPKKIVEQHLEPSGTSPRPFAEYPGLTDPTPSNIFIESYIGNDHPSTPQPPLKFDLPFESAPDGAGHFSPSHPKPIALTTSEFPQPSFFVHTTPKVAADYSSPSSSNPGVPRTIDGNYIGSSSSTPSPVANIIPYSTPLTDTEYSSPNPPIPTLFRLHGTTPGSIYSSTPSPQIPVGYFLPGPEMEFPISGDEEGRAYIPPVSTPKPLVR